MTDLIVCARRAENEADADYLLCNVAGAYFWTDTMVADYKAAQMRKYPFSRLALWFWNARYGSLARTTFCLILPAYIGILAVFVSGYFYPEKDMESFRYAAIAVITSLLMLYLSLKTSPFLMRQWQRFGVNTDGRWYDRGIPQTLPSFAQHLQDNIGALFLEVKFYIHTFGPDPILEVEIRNPSVPGKWLRRTVLVWDGDRIIEPPTS